MSFSSVFFSVSFSVSSLSLSLHLPLSLLLYHLLYVVSLLFVVSFVLLLGFSFSSHSRSACCQRSPATLTGKQLDVVHCVNHSLFLYMVIFEGNPTIPQYTRKEKTHRHENTI